MNKETYEALKDIIQFISDEGKMLDKKGQKIFSLPNDIEREIKRVESWVDAVAGKYKEEKRYNLKLVLSFTEEVIAKSEEEAIAEAKRNFYKEYNLLVDKYDEVIVQSIQRL